MTAFKQPRGYPMTQIEEYTGVASIRHPNGQRIRCSAQLQHIIELVDCSTIEEVMSGNQLVMPMASSIKLITSKIDRRYTDSVNIKFYDAARKVFISMIAMATWQMSGRKHCKQGYSSVGNCRITKRR